MFYADIKCKYLIVLTRIHRFFVSKSTLLINRKYGNLFSDFDRNKPIPEISKNTYEKHYFNYSPTF